MRSRRVYVDAHEVDARSSRKPVKRKVLHAVLFSGVRIWEAVTAIELPVQRPDYHAMLSGVPYALDRACAR